MNVNSLITMNYKNFIPLAEQKNKPNSNPISNPTLNFLSARGDFPSWFGPGKLFIAENG